MGMQLMINLYIIIILILYGMLILLLLIGTISTDISKLTSLVFLGCYANKFSNNLPSEFFTLTTLTLLSFDSNNLIGKLIF